MGLRLAVLPTAAPVGISIRTLVDPVSAAENSDDGASGAAGGKHPHVAGHPQHGLETGGRGRSHIAHFRSSRRDHRTALLPAVHHWAFGAGLVRARTGGAGGYALPALCALQSGLDAGAVELSGARGTRPGAA